MKSNYERLLSQDPVMPVLPVNYKACFIPKAFHNLEVDGWPEQDRENIWKAVDGVKKMMDDGRGLLITGNVRTGKSALSAIMMKQAIKYYARTYFISIINLRGIVEKDRNFATYVEDIYEKVFVSNLLVLDNLSPKSFLKSESHLMELLSARADDRRATIVTSSMYVTDIKRMLGAQAEILKSCCPIRLELVHGFPLDCNWD